MLGGVWGLSLAACSAQAPEGPGIELTQVPEAASGGAARMEPIAGRVRGAQPGQRIVLFAKSGTWWVQPFANKPFTPIGKDGSWAAETHMGTEYAALLVDADYLPPKVADVLPARGGGVVAIATAEGGPSSGTLAPKKILFSGYEWDVLQEPRDSNGVMHTNRAENAWTDDAGRLHLRLVREGADWAGAEVVLARSLGYGAYSFVISELPPLEPPTVLGILTWDPLDAGQNHREMDIQLSQWGDASIKNAQYVVQPHYVAANVHRFASPSGPITHGFEWAPGQVTFRTSQKGGGAVAERVFTSGVPTPGGERVHINLYVFGNTQTLQENGVEIVFEEFSHMP
jgi:hypothetical protein